MNLGVLAILQMTAKVFLGFASTLPPLQRRVTEAVKIVIS